MQALCAITVAYAQQPSLDQADHVSRGLLGEGLMIGSPHLILEFRDVLGQSETKALARSPRSIRAAHKATSACTALRLATRTHSAQACPKCMRPLQRSCEGAACLSPRGLALLSSCLLPWPWPASPHDPARPALTVCGCSHRTAIAGCLHTVDLRLAAPNGNAWARLSLALGCCCVSLRS